MFYFFVLAVISLNDPVQYFDLGNFRVKNYLHLPQNLLYQNYVILPLFGLKAAKCI